LFDVDALSVKQRLYLRYKGFVDIVYDFSSRFVICLAPVRLIFYFGQVVTDFNHKRFQACDYKNGNLCTIANEAYCIV